MRFPQKRLSYCIFVFVFVVLSGCPQAKESYGQSKFGDNSFYYMGLEAKRKGEASEAKSYFERCVKKGSGLAARRSFEALCENEDVQEKIEAAKNLVANYDDEKAMLIAARIFHEFNEPNLLVSITDKIDLKSSDNELIRLRFSAQKKRGGEPEPSDLLVWCFERPISSDHYKFLTENYASEFQQILEKTEFEDLWKKQLFLINFRLEVYKRNYFLAETRLSVIRDIIEENRDLLTEQLASDIGKTYLYGTSASLHFAQHLEEEAEKYKDTLIAFYYWFYAGRLYEKRGGYGKSAERSFIAAFECAEAFGRSDLKDNVLWYLFRTSLKSSVDSGIVCVKKYVAKITDPYYYDDFFDLFSQYLLTQKKYAEFGRLYKSMKGYASNESTAKYAYIYARLLEEKVVSDSEEEIREAYITALNSGTDMYYKVMAVDKLALDSQKKSEIYCKPRRLKDLASDTTLENADNIESENATDIKMENGIDIATVTELENGIDTDTATETGNENENQIDINQVDIEAEQLLNGYAFFGFPEKIYPEWIKLGSPLLSYDTTINLCKLLKNCSTGEDDFLVQSLRIAAKTANYSKTPLTPEVLEYVYPRNYEDFVKKYCAEYQLKESVLWALIRSESFFDPDVKSSAGAIGLCQLMPITGEDVARRLKKTDYDLTNPETSIEFGAYYLSNLLVRLDGSYLDAFFSYNAGITRVRNWKNAFSIGKLKEIPGDLFLEILPFTETREYGRKLVSATAMYEWLYD